MTFDVAASRKTMATRESSAPRKTQTTTTTAAATQKCVTTYVRPTLAITTKNLEKSKKCSIARTRKTSTSSKGAMQRSSEFPASLSIHICYRKHTRQHHGETPKKGRATTSTRLTAYAAHGTGCTVPCKIVWHNRRKAAHGERFRRGRVVSSVM